jgi:hypothetical protein
MSPFVRNKSFWWSALTVSAVAGCGGASGIDGNFSAVHNTVAAIGWAQTGPVHEGHLDAGGEARLTSRLSAGACYAFVGFGDGIEDLDVRLFDEGGTEVAHETAHDRQATLQFCAEREGDYVLVVRAEGGGGRYRVGTWSGGGMSAPAALARGTSLVGPRGLFGGGAGGGGGNSCASPLPLQMGQPIQGNTSGNASSIDPACARNGGPEQVYTFRLDQRRLIHAVLQSSFDGVLYLRRECTGPDIECNDDAGSTQRSEISTALDPGTYFLVVDGFGPGASGAYELVVSASDAPTVENVCRDAQPLVSGRPVQGTTANSMDTFTATCAGGARSPEQAYRLEVQQRSRLRVRHETTEHDGSLHIRRECASATSEIACDDDFGDNRHSLITTVVDPGTYFVFADGYAQAQGGPFTLQADLSPEGAGGALGDNCAAPQPLATGAQQVDTFAANDDFSGSCGGAGAADVVHRIEVRERTRLRVSFERPEFNGVAYLLQRSCERGAQELACAAFSRGDAGRGGPVPSPMAQAFGGPGPSATMPPRVPGRPPVAPPPQATGAAIDTVLAPGTYFLVVDGSQADAFGAVGMQVTMEDPAAAERMCREAPLLQTGRATTGSTAGQPDRFHGSCANGTASGDRLYRIQLRRRSLVRVSMESPEFDGALYLRRDCASESSEVACNDDSSDQRHSLVEATLDAGTYYVVVDGFGSGNEGNFTLTYEAFQAQ